MKKVVKFGGSSLASAEQFKKVGAIISADESRVYVVPSAPGKRFPEDTKVTDMLLHVYETAKAGEDITEEMKAIKARYDEIITGLALKDFSLDKDFEEITKKLVENPQVDYAASRGEFLNGKIMAAYLGVEFIDAAEVIFFNAEGNLNSYKTEKVLSERLSKAPHANIRNFHRLTRLIDILCHDHRIRMCRIHTEVCLYCLQEFLHICLLQPTHMHLECGILRQYLCTILRCHANMDFDSLHFLLLV